MTDDDDTTARVEALHDDHRQDMKLFGVEINKLRADLAAKDAEIERLTKALATANANHEHFEREWYLRGDECDRLRAELAVAREVLADAFSWITVERDSFFATNKFPGGRLAEEDEKTLAEFDALLNRIDAAIKGES